MGQGLYLWAHSGARDAVAKEDLRWRVLERLVQHRRPGPVVQVPHRVRIHSTAPPTPPTLPTPPQHPCTLTIAPLYNSLATNLARYPWFCQPTRDSRYGLGCG
jgi:hypothetical protein